MKTSIRTLLALSDPACEPEFRKILEKRIRTSEEREEVERFIHRVQKIRGIPLRGPELVDGTEELDPNDVAEYLDHKLSAEEERRFESLFLSSDVFLAELADVSSFLGRSLGHAEISDEIRTRLYEIQVSVPVEQASPPAEKIEAYQKYTPKNLQESLDNWKWERLNRLKNIIVSVVFLVAGLLVWSNQEAINQWIQKDRDQEKTANLFDVPSEAILPTPSVLESVEWSENKTRNEK